ncbi:LOW QUALITY PROTEIN: protein stoned-B-like [Harmonia axyridis]|uniref:LOW QUALITY PROTEIN: protein stoned-B-like n=1 Tax=Harmonia axyridis TaxID=115357 RepID=UPI001E276283|nr:LOW QUALITY PROTEIN: protein stoned-B-like [Harmonia axyridis]
MHKITKGLKKKKKGKKSKHKEEELFKPEELEAYRREHQAHSASGAENEEWKKFHALTSGVDNVLQKTQEELSRIKETSFFQRVPPPSQVQRTSEKEPKKEVVKQDQAPVDEQPQIPDPNKLGIVEVSDSESDAEYEDDDIFDTAYIDAIAAGEVKLAYIPESPTDFGGDDPFDTSYAEKAILGPAAETKKGKKLVPIGSAVEVLTGRVQLPTCSTQRPASNRRQIFKERDLLLGSFDNNANSIAECIKESPPKTLLDEEAPPDLSSEPIDLSKSLYIPPIPVTPSPISQSSGVNQEDSEDDEFAQLASENLNKGPANVIEKLPVVTPDVAQVIEDHWDAFVDEKKEFPQSGVVAVEEPSEVDVDPFDTTFAENILPGKAELKQIESEILNAQIEFEVKPRQEKLLHILKKLSVSEEGSRDKFTDSNLHTKNIERDLLGGSNTDLNNLYQPLTPAAQLDDNYIEYRDPFDTSIVETVKNPGQAELKFIEKELLSDIKNNSVHDLSDDDFNPRAEEIKEPPRERSISRPDVLNVVTSKSVCFDDTSIAKKDFIGIPENSSKLGKPPTPFYVRKNSVPGAQESDLSPDQIESNTSGIDSFKSAVQDLNPDTPPEGDFDPFDTSIADNFVGNAIKDIMEVKGVNPFLFAEDDHTSPSSATSNPFLMDSDTYAENDYSQNAFASSGATNPFAFDPMDLGEGEPAPNIFGDNTFVSNDTPFSVNNLQTSSTDQIMTQATITINSGNQDFFLMSDNDFAASTNTCPPPIKPTDLNLKTTNTVDPFNEESLRQPPSKETQDLLMSVMGAMDATSSHLLNKIPPTRSPSPVSMRDLHSPSPTPDMYGDLLDVGDSTPSTRTPEHTKKENLFDTPTNMSCDINQNPSVAKQPPPKPPPPRPAPPRPAPPAIVQAPPKPPPPKPEQPMAPREFDSSKNYDNDICLFGVDGTLPKKAPTTKEDILNLYNTAKSEKKVDLLSGSDEALNINPVDNFPQSSSNSILSLDSTPQSHVVEEHKIETVQEPIAQDNFISPEVSQGDLQMDTSDSHSKGSVSSVTFNPFATSEEMNEMNTREEVSQLASSPFQTVPADVIPTNIQQTHSTDLPFSEVPENKNTFAQIPDYYTQNASGDAFGTANGAFGISNDFGAPMESIGVSGDAFGVSNAIMEEATAAQDAFGGTNQNFSAAGYENNTTIQGDDFDEFAQKFDSVKSENQTGDSFAWGGGSSANAFGEASSEFGTAACGFEADEPFDSFLALQEPPCVPQSTPYVLSKQPSADSDEDKDFSVFIKPKNDDDNIGGMGVAMPILAPPPTVQQAFSDTSPRFNPFDQSEDVATVDSTKPPPLSLDGAPQIERSGSQETPPTPLFDEDVSQPLAPFPRIDFAGEGWEMQLRQPNKKKITGQRFWKKIFVRLVYQPDCVLLQLFNQKDDKDPFQELPLQPCYSVSDIGAQQYDQFGKIFTLKLQYIFYKERPGVRPGQVKKAEKLSNRLSKFAAYAIQGDYEGVKEFGSDLKKLGLPVEHAPQVSQLMKLGSLSYEDLKQFSFSIEEALFRLQAHRDRALQYKMEEVQITVVDELYVDQDADGHIERQIARVRLFFLGFLTGMPDIELGVNDMRRQGKEVVGRHDIIPVVTEEWIRLEATEFHSCVQQDEYERTHVIKFKPPDACYIELMRFRVRPPRNRELPLQLKASICVTGTKIELRADVLVPGFASRKLGQIPCEDVQIRFPIPECWIYLFRVEKHFRYGSVKSAHRRTGKIKGIERILGTMDTLQESLIEVTSGQAKYEHQHRAIVWRCPRLPKEGQGAYTTHNMVCRLALTSYDQMPEKLAEYCYVEFTMPATQVSHCVCRSVSLQNSDSDDPPEKYVRNLARHEYRVGIEHVEGENPNAYAIATKPIHTVKEEKPAPVPEADSSSDSD